LIKNKWGKRSLGWKVRGAEGPAEKGLKRGKREDRKKGNSREKVVQSRGELERKRRANLSL